MTTLMAWLKAHENDPHAQMPRVLEIVNARRSFSQEYGQRNAERLLTEANEARETNEARLRNVGVALEAIQQKIQTDPTYSARDAARDTETLRGEFTRLKAALPELATKVENARAIASDPVAWAENTLARFPMLADRLPGLPTF
jgi:hypothetical protein